jgi:hypothetical protein
MALAAEIAGTVTALLRRLLTFTFGAEKWFPTLFHGLIISITDGQVSNSDPAILEDDDASAFEVDGEIVEIC